MLHTDSLRKNSQFRYVYNKGRSVADRLVVVYVLPNKLEINRLGLSVSKKVGGSVVRNRVRRLIRESYRSIEAEGIITGFDIVVIARQVSADARYIEIRYSLKKLLSRQSLFQKNNSGRAK